MLAAWTGLSENTSPGRLRHKLKPCPAPLEQKGLSDLKDIDIVFLDMDHTLIDNDCDVSWKEFLVEIKVAPADERIEAQKHWEAYCAGALDEEAFLAFQLRQFKAHTPEEMRALSRRHFEQRVRPRIYPQAREVIAEARRHSLPAVLLSATNRIILEPLVKELGLDGALCTELQMENGRFTGRIIPPYCVEDGKIHHAEAYCREHGLSLDRAAYYGDSVNDIPMLERVACPVAVNPEGKLLDLARRRGWPIESWSLEPAQSRP